MDISQAIDYLEAVADIAPSEMSRGMFKLVRSAARRANSAYPGMAGYYDPEYTGPRADPARYAYFRAWGADVIPQSSRLQDALAKAYPIEDAFDLASII